jgi:hypothetical protein
MAEKVTETFISCSRSLLKLTERLMELITMVRIFLIFKAQWLLHIDFLLNIPFKKALLASI